MENSKKFAILGNLDNPEVLEVVHEITNTFKAEGILYDTYSSTGDFEQEIQGLVPGCEPELAIVIGGDGTFMNAARLLADYRVPLIGVNLGRRGFLTDVSVREVKKCLVEILNGQYKIETRTLIEASVEHHEKSEEKYNALNDIVVIKTNFGRLLEFEIHVDGDFVTTTRADGLIVSTPTGSTAYSLSAGGPILYPTLPALLLLPISPHTLTNRPIVLSDDCEIEIRLVQIEPEHSCISVDGHLRMILDGTETIKVRRSKKSVKLVRVSGHTFYNQLRQKLGWGVESPSGSK